MKIFGIVPIIILTAGFLFADDFIIDEPENDNNMPKTEFPIDNTSKNTRSGEKFQTVNSESPYPHISIGSIPTAHLLSAGKIETEFIFYDNGGFTTRMLVGIFDSLSIGISENIDRLIGYETMNFNIPGAFLKFNILRDVNHFGLSVGFDSFAFGRNGSYTDTNLVNYTVYGFFTTAGFDYSILGGNDGFHFGLRFPLFPLEFASIANTTLFFGTTLQLTDTIELGFTLENFYLDFSRFDRILPSFIVTVIPIPSFRLYAIFQYEFYSSRLNRILGLSYQFGF